MSRRTVIWPYLTLRDVGGILAAIVLLAAVLFASAIAPQIRAKINYGFGPEWDCSFPGKGSPVCVKRVVNSGAAIPGRQR